MNVSANDGQIEKENRAMASPKLTPANNVKSPLLEPSSPQYIAPSDVWRSHRVGDPNRGSNGGECLEE